MAMTELPGGKSEPTGGKAVIAGAGVTKARENKKPIPPKKKGKR